MRLEDYPDEEPESQDDKRRDAHRASVVAKIGKWLTHELNEQRVSYERVGLDARTASGTVLRVMRGNNVRLFTLADIVDSLGYVMVVDFQVPTEQKDSMPVIGHICAKNHPRIAYRGDTCPMCVSVLEISSLSRQQKRLADQIASLNQRLEEAVDGQ